MAAKLISIIGPPGCGKTTLAKCLCQDLRGQLILEDFAGNPFLADSYQGDAQARLPGQLYFLMSRVQQLSILAWPKEGLFVSDYGFCQDAIYAHLRLDPDEQVLYNRLSARLAKLVRPPDIIIHLRTDVAVLIERIAQRGRDYEKVMTPDFLHQMQEAYDEVVAALACLVLRVDNTSLDLREASHRASLVQGIQAQLQTLTSL